VKIVHGLFWYNSVNECRNYTRRQEKVGGDSESTQVGNVIKLESLRKLLHIYSFLPGVRGSKLPGRSVGLTGTPAKRRRAGGHSGAAKGRPGRQLRHARGVSPE